MRGVGAVHVVQTGDHKGRPYRSRGMRPVCFV